MTEIMVREASTCDMKELVLKFIPESIGKDIEKVCIQIHTANRGNEQCWVCFSTKKIYLPHDFEALAIALNVAVYLGWAFQACAGIYPLSNVYLRKVKILKAPKFDIGKLMEVHGDFTEEVSANNPAPQICCG